MAYVAPAPPSPGSRGPTETSEPGREKGGWVSPDQAMELSLRIGRRTWDGR